MKLIGQSEHGLLIAATPEEVANLLGYWSDYDVRKKIAIKPGLEIRIAPMFRQLTALAKMRAQLEGARKTLETAAGLLALVEPAVPIIDLDKVEPLP